jgi:hypothetical protein
MGLFLGIRLSKKKNGESKMVIIIIIMFRVSVKLGLMSLKNCNLVTALLPSTTVTKKF